MSKIQDLLDRKEKAERDKIRLEENLKHLQQNRDNKAAELLELGLDVTDMNEKDIANLIKDNEDKLEELVKELENALVA